MSDLVICKHRKEYGHTWHRISLLKPGVIKNGKFKLLQRDMPSVYLIISQLSVLLDEYDMVARNCDN